MSRSSKSPGPSISAILDGAADLIARDYDHLTCLAVGHFALGQFKDGSRATRVQNWYAEISGEFQQPHSNAAGFLVWTDFANHSTPEGKQERLMWLAWLSMMSKDSSELGGMLVERWNMLECPVTKGRP